MLLTIDFLSGPWGVFLAAACLGLAAVLGGLLIQARRQLRRQSRWIARQQGVLELQRTAADMHAMVNISDAEGRITYVNENLVRTTGYAAEELLGKRYRDVLLHDALNDPDTVYEHLQEGRVWMGESRLRHRDGSSIWTRTTILPQMDGQGRLKAVIAARTDISESKLHAHERPVRAIFDRLQDEVYIFRVEDLALEYVNKTGRDLRGWSEGECTGKHVSDIATSFDEGKFRERARPLLDGEVEALIYEATLMGRPVEINLQIVPNSDGELRFVAVVRDITARKAQEAARMAFVATVTHELRTPLTSIKGAMKLVASGATGEIPAKPRQMLDLALRNVERLLHLINDLLDLEKLDNDTTKIRSDPVDLAELVAESVAQNVGYAREFGVRLATLDPAPDYLPIRGDRDRLIQVLTNLVSNAIKFSDTGGVVEVGLADLGTTARISVIDHGIGIPVEAQSRLFERFVQADTEAHNQRKGTGLGLSIVKTIVERHGGSVNFTSAPGEGTTFHVDLPKSKANLRAVA